MAYGKVRGVAKALGEIPARIYPIEHNSSDARAAIITFPYDFAAGDELDSDVKKKLHGDFNEVIEDGRTYPQEDIMDVESYAAYFLSYDLVVGFFLTRPQLEEILPSAQLHADGTPLTRSQVTKIRIGSSKLRILSDSTSPTINLPNDADTYAFAYYIKPNYPGRSSHLCNGGFMVPLSSRGLGLGRIAARSFCYYAPRRGYRGSVFNLVYVNNDASVKLWTKLGFQNVGRIPEAGRLRTKDGSGEEYVDAWVIHGDFTKIGYRDVEEA